MPADSSVLSEASGLDALSSGGKAAMARALAQLERAPRAAATLGLLDEAWAGARAEVLGLTGPPGVGKSTLLRALIARFREAGLSVGVIAVDPSSRRSGGALLGDRVRLQSDPEDEGLFVRSMAARDRLGGLADLTAAAMVLMRAVYDRVVVETVGVGQSETEIAGVADSVVFCVQPGSGDSLQFMKAGIVEIPDIAVVTKADLGRPAERAVSDLRAAMALVPAGAGRWSVPVLPVSATERSGMDDLIEALAAHAAHLRGEGRLTARRAAQARGWLADGLRARFGSWGLERAGPLELAPGQSPFKRLAELAERLEAGVG